MKKIVCCFIVLCIGCAGNSPRLVDTYQLGDENLSCREKALEMKSLDAKMRNKYKERQSKIISNTFLFAVGCFFLWPLWFAMDGKSDQKAEIRAMEQRKIALQNLYIEDGCDNKALK